MRDHWSTILDVYGRYRRSLRNEDTRRVEFLGTFWTAWIAFCLWYTPDYFAHTAASVRFGTPVGPWLALEDFWMWTGAVIVGLTLTSLYLSLTTAGNALGWRKWCHLLRAAYIGLTGYILADGVWWVISVGGHVAVCAACIMSFLHLDVRHRRPRAVSG